MAKMSGVENRCSDYSFPVAMGQVFACRAGVSPAEVQSLFTAHCYVNRLPSSNNPTLQRRCLQVSSPHDERDSREDLDGF